VVYIGVKFIKIHIKYLTLSARLFRLLTKLKQSQIFSVTLNTTTSSITSLASNNGDGYYCLYLVNDNNKNFTLKFNLASWKISDQ